MRRRWSRYAASFFSNFAQGSLSLDYVGAWRSLWSACATRLAATQLAAIRLAALSPLFSCAERGSRSGRAIGLKTFDARYDPWYELPMSCAKITISIDKELLKKVDRLVKACAFHSRSEFIEAAVRKRIVRTDRSRLARECSKLDKAFEQALADQGLDAGFVECL
jgi:Arc/MetJ-type ribon-helix-helix transcriptional regulator